MPDLEDRPELLRSKSLIRREARQQRRIVPARLGYVGETLASLAMEVRCLLRTWTAADAITNPLERADILLKLAKALDVVRERRRILLRQPLPGSRSANRERHPIVDLRRGEALLDAQPVLPEPVHAVAAADDSLRIEPLGQPA